MQEQIKDLFIEVQREAGKEGAEAEVVVSNTESFSTNFIKGALNKYSCDNSISVGVRVLYGRGAGFSTTEKLSKESLIETFKEALVSAKDLDKEAKTDRRAQNLYRPKERPSEMILSSPEIDQVEISQKLKIAQTLEKAALEFDPRVQSVPYSGYHESKSKRYLFSTVGVDLSQESAGISAYSFALSKSGEDLKTGHSSGFFRQPKHLDADKIAKDAAQRAVSLLGAIQPKSGKYTVVLSSQVASDLVGFLDYHLSAKALDEGKSLLKGKIGEKIFSEKITLTDDPFKTEISGARPFDSEGAPSQKTVAVKSGTFQSFLSNSYLAEKLQIPHTANAVRSGGEMSVGSSNMVIQPGNSSLEDLLQSDKEVILITAVDALHSGFKEMTLDFSLPAYGFLYKGGAPVKPVHQIVMSGNLMSLLQNVDKISAHSHMDGRSVSCPDLLVPEMSIAGN